MSQINTNTNKQKSSLYKQVVSIIQKKEVTYHETLLLQGIKCRVLCMYV